MIKSGFFNSELVTMFHYCSRDFYNSLLINKTIKADSRNTNIRDSYPASYICYYYFRKLNINNGNGMFFCWSNPYYKGDGKLSHIKGDFILLELKVPKEEVLSVGYEDWCSIGVDLYEFDNDIVQLDRYYRKSYDKSFIKMISLLEEYDTSSVYEIQHMLRNIKAEWVVNYTEVCFKNI